ncbi:hypothetical protein HK098_003128 [Nowakowskiella sp. JEL0407]|nr:hypothetical protein HK098_003128 [Nowakowskiella sp. JEL0407]
MFTWVNSFISPSSPAKATYNEGWEFLDTTSFPLPDAEILSETLSDFAWKDTYSEEEQETTSMNSETKYENDIHPNLPSRVETESIHSFMDPTQSMLVPTLLAARKVIGRRRSMSVISNTGENSVISTRRSQPAVSNTAEQYVMKLKDRELKLKKLQKMDQRHGRSHGGSGRNHAKGGRSGARAAAVFCY